MIFKLYSFVSSLIYSFHGCNLPRTASFAGLDNYKKILGDPLIMKAFAQTFKYAFLTVPLELIFVLLVAYIPNSKIKSVNFFGTAYYIPPILGRLVSIAILWRFLLKAEGFVNTIGSGFDTRPFNWLGDSAGTFRVIVLLRIWQSGSPMVIFFAASKGVPQDLYEVVPISGAGKWKQFFSMTIPLITPVTFYSFIIQPCNESQEFNGPFIVTQGGSFHSITLISLLVYNNAFRGYEMGMAGTITWLLFLIIMALMAASSLSQRYWVCYLNRDGR